MIGQEGAGNEEPIQESDPLFPPNHSHRNGSKRSAGGVERTSGHFPMARTRS